MHEYLATLNDEQKKAVLTTEGPVLIVAGAGAGKTKTLTSRIIHLIHEGVTPEHILAITFTNKAAKEMRERVVHNLPYDTTDTFASIPFIATFHALGVSILKTFGDKTSRGRHFSILDESDSMSLLKEAITEAGLDPKQYEPKRFRAIISREKGQGILVHTYKERAESAFDELVADVWERYEKKLTDEKGFDFDDLLLVPLKLLQSNADVRSYYHTLFEYIHVDEYQDTNTVQYELVKLLLNEKQNLCVVGDTDQNIYSWRGANLKNMLHFERDFPNAHIFFLEQNYRSSKVILEAANEVIKKNTVRVPKNLFTTADGGDTITLIEGYDERHEAECIADAIIEVWDDGIRPDDIAVLYRANFQSRVLEEALLARNIPYHVLGVRFFERKEIKDALSYLRASLNQSGLSDIKRAINTPARGIGKVTLVKLFAGQKETLPRAMQEKIDAFYRTLGVIKASIETSKASDAVKKMIEASGLKDQFDPRKDDDLERIENLKELVTLATKYDQFEAPLGIEKLLEEAALQSDQDSLDKPKEGVKLMTIHAAKGLEFDTVFITGLEHGLFPHARDDAKTKEDSEEERRLFYVALTRAKRKLFLTYATTRTIFGMRQIEVPSEFLLDVPEHLVERSFPKAQKQKVIYIE